MTAKYQLTNIIDNSLIQSLNQTALNNSQYLWNALALETESESILEEIPGFDSTTNNSNLRTMWFLKGLTSPDLIYNKPENFGNIERFILTLPLMYSIFNETNNVGIYLAYGSDPLISGYPGTFCSYPLVDSTTYSNFTGACGIQSQDPFYNEFDFTCRPWWIQTTAQSGIDYDNLLLLLTIMRY